MVLLHEKILVVDDEKEITDLIEVYLQNEGMEVCKFYDGQSALACIARTPLDLAILDIMLPDIDGFALCRAIRGAGQTYPILFLSARGEELDKITGLTLGADDYMTKPFHPLELVARVKAQLRRYRTYQSPGTPEAAGVLAYGGLRMDVQAHTCSADGAPLSLTPTEFSILQILLEHQGSVVSAESLFRAIWADEYFSKNNNTITAHIRHLREKTDRAAGKNYITTVWGVGYKLE